MAGATHGNMEREYIRRKLPYAAGLQLIHADLVWRGSKFRWQQERLSQDADTAARMAAVRENLNKTEIEDELWL